MGKFKNKCNRWGGIFDYYSKDNLKKLVKLNICGVCMKKIKTGEDKDLHHIEYFVDGGSSEPENICWLHLGCHVKLHRQDNNLRRRVKYKKKLSKLKSDGVI